MVTIYHATDAATASIIARDGVKSPKSRSVAVEALKMALTRKGWNADMLAFNCWSGSFFTTRPANLQYGPVVIAVDIGAGEVGGFEPDDFGPDSWSDYTLPRDEAGGDWRIQHGDIEHHAQSEPGPFEMFNGWSLKVTVDIPAEAVRILTRAEVADLKPWRRADEGWIRPEWVPGVLDS